ncbi:hypothetical protein [Caulobacter phage Cr30]|uniref:hypothetical protein n=1 Tax=Caulobacter phage Cr30 TaxID=1357714 RepID=UPI0004A9B946|nr:hypothetical protein OZ74_gp131 [Caulobacter phage Cr30]AGS81016.1 hypothetical protein [Caulobacter phage Cr30]
MSIETYSEKETNLAIKTFFAACSFTIFTVLIGFFTLLQTPFGVVYFTLKFFEIKLYELQDRINEWMIKS